MATRAEEFRYWAERSGPKKAKQLEKAHGKAHGEALGAGHESGHAGRRATYALEDSAGPPSRKSTRKASNRQKTDVQFRMKHKLAEGRPPPRTH